MHTRISLAIAAAGLALSLAACGSDGDSEGSVADCKAAMTEQMQDAVETGAEGDPPAACIGIDDKTLERIAGEVIEEELGDAVDKELEKLEDTP